MDALDAFVRRSRFEGCLVGSSDWVGTSLETVQ
jgi:hypothetical protein